MHDKPYTFPQWEEQRTDDEYPSQDVLYSWTRPGPVNDELTAAGVISRVANRWMFNPGRWRNHCETNNRLK